MSTEQGEEFAKEHNLLFLETSALGDNNVSQVFLEVGSQIMQKIKNRTIDVNIEEYGVRKAGKDLLNYNEYDRLVKKTKKDKKKCKC